MNGGIPISPRATGTTCPVTVAETATPSMAVTVASRTDGRCISPPCRTVYADSPSPGSRPDATSHTPSPSAAEPVAGSSGTPRPGHLPRPGQAPPDHRHGGAHARMAGEGQLLLGREDPRPVRRARLGGRQHEHRLGQVELPGQRLQLSTGEGPGLEHHRERVAGERPVGEDIHDLVREATHPSTIGGIYAGRVTTATRVYVARVAGLPVFDPNGDQVGRVRDAVARLRGGNQPPRVVGLVAE